MKNATGQLSDLDDCLENFSPISRDAKTLRQQLEEIKSLETELTMKEDTIAQLETQCRKLTHAGYIQEPQLYKVFWEDASVLPRVLSLNITFQRFLPFFFCKIIR